MVTKARNIKGRLLFGQGFAHLNLHFTQQQKRFFLATSQQLSNFLIASERRAYKQAYFATRNSESALDIVQEAMMKLSASYGDRPAEELPLLFTRILQNTVYDFHRKNKTRSMWTTLFSAFSPKGEDEFDILETLQVEETNSISQAPDKNLIQAQTLAIIEEEIPCAEK